jgi:hypothetical protein
MRAGPSRQQTEDREPELQPDSKSKKSWHQSRPSYLRPSYLFTFLPFYLLTFLPSYLLTFLPSYLLTFVVRPYSYPRPSYLISSGLNGKDHVVFESGHFQVASRGRFSTGRPLSYKATSPPTPRGLATCNLPVPQAYGLISCKPGQILGDFALDMTRKTLPGRRPGQRPQAPPSPQASAQHIKSQTPPPEDYPGNFKVEFSRTKKFNGSSSMIDAEKSGRISCGYGRFLMRILKTVQNHLC